MAAVFMLVSSSWAAREHRLGFGDARELKNFGEHSPNIYIYIYVSVLGRI